MTWRLLSRVNLLLMLTTRSALLVSGKNVNKIEEQRIDNKLSSLNGRWS